MTAKPDVRSDWTIELGGGVTMAFARIPSGEFLMGSRGYSDDEEPMHRVSITRSFYLGVLPVTNAQYATWCERPADWKSGEPDRPAVELSWLDAQNFCCWLSELPDLPAGLHADLPTEAQWEYACRTGTQRTEYFAGDGELALESVGWHYQGDEGMSTEPVGTKKPSGWGLFDMHGNVDEWCRDAWDPSAYRHWPDGVCDPFVDAQDEHAPRVVRGGSRLYLASDCRSACRIRAGRSRSNRGFRVGLFSGKRRNRWQA